MRALMALTIGMGVLIVIGVAVISVTIVKRMNAGGGVSLADVVLTEPAGTHITSISAAGDRVAVLLTGGGPDRVVIWDTAHGRVGGRLQAGH